MGAYEATTDSDVAVLLGDLMLINYALCLQQTKLLAGTREGLASGALQER